MVYRDDLDFLDEGIYTIAHMEKVMRKRLGMKEPEEDPAEKWYDVIEVDADAELGMIGERVIAIILGDRNAEAYVDYYLKKHYPDGIYLREKHDKM